MKNILFLSLVSISLLSGCATITGDSMQTIAISTETLEGVAVADVDCTLKNEKGEWAVVSPNMVTVHKASGDLSVNCKKPELPDGQIRAISRAGAGMYGNILIGGGVGALIDHSKGTAYNYPDNLPVVMGKSIVIDRKNSKSKKDKDADGATEENVETDQASGSLQTEKDNI